MNAETSNRTFRQPPAERIPPHDQDAEMAVLGAMMLDRDAISTVLPILNRGEGHWFYYPEHGELFGVVLSMYDSNKAIDLVTVRDELKRRELLEPVGGVGYLVALAESVPSAANAEQYARIVREKGLLRDLIRCTGEISELAYSHHETPTDELIDEAEQKFYAVTERRISRQASRLREVLKPIHAQLEAGDDGRITGLPTGFTELNDLLNGYQPGDFIIVAGRPSMGKTAFGLTSAVKMAVDENIPVAFFSMEMSNQQVGQRILCSRGRIDSHRFRKRMISEAEIHDLGLVCEQLSSAPLFIDDTPGMSGMELRANVRRLVRQHGIRAVFVDYLQLMRAPGAKARHEEIGEISRGLKAIGRELNVAVIAMAQLNRQSEGREGHRPRMSDLRESGSLEQDADVVILLHREEYYKPQDTEVKGIADVIIAKQRNGPTDVIQLQFDKRLTLFSNLSHVSQSADTYQAAQKVPF